ncbi:PIN domain-containing protein [Corynebacterium suedekumii]|uniref:PIN domain-containing protein n=1 Tax=Corynebacterium suedekumii TaxID=3049801 RepID=A0ABY8VJA2_9CORY|nr:hypothetical protein [Corynebacterium suedekumii]WIM69157.1 hypothetical protein QP029_07590 [Corynebacterium suedekumii]
MDPLAATAVKDAGSLAGKPIFKILAKPIQRFRVARMVVKTAKKEEILVKWLKLSSLLKDADTRSAIASGDPQALQEFADRLSREVKPTGPDMSAVVARIIDLVQDELLRLMPEGEARLAQTRRLENAFESSAHQQRELLTASGDEVAFVNAIEKLHPWRAETAREIAAQWSAFRGLVITLTKERDRHALLMQWGGTPPAAMSGAPAEVWCWFACVAADYGAEESALQFITKGVEAGGSASYWWARAGLMVGTATPEASARARELWSRSIPKHPIAEACEAIEQGEYVKAEQILDAWDSEKPDDKAFRAVLQAAAVTGQGDFNRAIAIGKAAAVAQPEGSGNTLRTAEALMTRGYHRLSDHPLDDFAQAFNLAVQVRDSRRIWLGDSVAPILVAVKASVLATNTDQAWRLTQEAPDGVALPHEARDERLREQSAILAATMGRFEQARTIADTLDNPFISYTVDGWEASNEDRWEDAEEAWFRAWDCAPDDISRLQTASALANLGRGLPDLNSLPEEYSSAIERILTHHEVLSSEDPMALLRVRATKSTELTILYAEQLAAQGEIEEAAAVLESGGLRWSHPLMTQMAAGRYVNIGNYEKAYAVAATALSLGGSNWAGRLDTLMIQFTSLEAQGDFSRSLAIAREMVTLAPENLDVRWVLVHSLIRAGNIHEAWRALTHQGRPIDPRNHADARTWIGLAAEYDNSPEFVQRSLEMMSDWQHEADVVGVFLSEIYRGLHRHEREVTEADLGELHKVTKEFTDKHPENQVFRKISLDEADPFGSLTALLKDHATVDPAIKDIQKKIEHGELPLGFTTALARRTYVEVCLTGVGLIHSHLPTMAAVGQSAAKAAIDSRVVIDASAVATLTLLDATVADKLVAAFFALETTDAAFRDALAAQRSINMQSTMTLQWDTKHNQPLAIESGPGEAEELSRRANRVVELLTRSERRSWPTLRRFADFARGGSWLSALDLALSEGLPFWCDDRSLRQIAASKGAQTFGTVDLLAALKAEEYLDPGLEVSIRASLVVGRHVDLDFDPAVLTLAAEREGWMAKGAAVALTRVHSWRDPAICMRFATTAMTRSASVSPSSVAHWTAAAALGLIRIASDNEGASENLKLLLTHQFAQPWLRPNTLPFVVQGIRGAIQDLPEIDDPLPEVMALTYARIAEKHGTPSAAEFLLMLVKNLDEEDRITATKVILMGDSR